MSDAIRASLTPTTVTIVRDGDPVEVVVTIQNVGATVDQYAVELDGLPTTWYSLSNSSVALFPQDKDEAKLIVRPPKGGAAKAGAYPFRVIVLSRADPTQTTRVEGILNISAVSAFELDMSPRKVVGRRGRYRVSMRNGGNADLDVALEATDAEDACHYAFQPAAVHLTPGQQATVQLRVGPKRLAMVGPLKQYDFQVKARPSQGEAKTLPGQLVYTPRLGSWKPIRGLALLIVLIAIIVVAIASQGGIDGVKARSPQWKNSASTLICQKLNVLCTATPTSVGPRGTAPTTIAVAVLNTATSTPAPAQPTAKLAPPSATDTVVPPTAAPATATEKPVPPTAVPPTATAKPDTATTIPPSSTPLPPPTATPRPAPHTPTPAQYAAPLKGAEFFSHTQHNLSGPFLSFWQMYGGLNVFGYPRTEAFAEGSSVLQYTDRFLLELVDGQLRTGPLGRTLTAGRTFPRIAPFTSSPDRMYFASTGHSLAGLFLTYWRSHHGAILLGAPIAEPTHEQNNDGSGRTYLMQWFENGRLEYHPEIANPRYHVELGLVGKQVLQKMEWLPLPPQGQH